MSDAWRLERGAVPHGDGVGFSVWAPHAQRVDVLLESGAAVGAHRLEIAESSVFSGWIAGARHGDDYRFSLDGGEPRPDPVSRHQPGGVHGPSRVVDPSCFSWSDGGWRGRPMNELVLYELHVGTFTPEGTFDAVIPRLNELADLGVTAVELMPVAEFPGARNWGYDGVDLYAAHHAYGGPEGLARLVDAAHARGLAVILDVVFNHLGPEGNYLSLYGPYFTDRYATPWGSAVNFDGAGSDNVRRFVVDNALAWITDHHVDGLRLDAVHGIFDAGPVHILQELVARVKAQGAALGRNVLVIAESDLNDPRLVREPARCGYGLDAQWSDDFHHAVHASLTGERSGYYEDFGALRQVGDALVDRFVYTGARSEHRGRRHGAPAGDVPRDRFVVCIQNHDQVGNRATGERLGALVSPARLRLAAALLLLSPFVPLLFMGEEYAEPAPFQYFVSHGDAALVEAVRTGRTQEFASFDWTGAVPDPQADTTFRRSRLDWSARSREPHAQTLRLYRDLLAFRAAEPALWPGAGEVKVHVDESAGWLVEHLAAPGARELVAVFNFRCEEGTSIPLHLPGAWSLCFTTDGAPYGGADRTRFDGSAVHLAEPGAALLAGTIG